MYLNFCIRYMLLILFIYTTIQNFGFFYRLVSSIRSLRIIHGISTDSNYYEFQASLVIQMSFLVNIL